MAAIESIKPIPEGFQVLKEGKASILQRKGTNEVFYNNAQVTNRDLSICVLRQFLPLRAKEFLDSGPKGEQQLKQQRRRERKSQEQLKLAGTSAAPAAAIDAVVSIPRVTVEPAAEPTSGAAVADVGVSTGVAGEPSTGSSSAAAAGILAAAQRTAPGAKVLEGLAASGLRSIRYALEVPGIAQIDANDLDKNAAASIRRNADYNGPVAGSLVRQLHSDARLTMLQHPLGYDVVDLDPYGTPAMFLDSAVQCVRDGGLLLVTATDMANLCGSNGVSAFSNYGAYPVHRPYCHEMALRILLGCIESHACRYKRHIVPLLSVSVDFYVRVFVRVYTSASAAKDSACKLAYVWQSSGCDSFYLQSLGQKKVHGTSVKYVPGAGPAVPQECPETGSGFLMGGPVWSEPIHDLGFVQGMLTDLERDKNQFAAAARVRGLLLAVKEELPDVPLYYNLHDLCKTAKCQPPKGETFRSALVNAGYRVSGSHANPNACKTDAPPEVIWDIVRCWIRDHPIAGSKDKGKGNPYIAKLLTKEPVLKADFSRAEAAVSRAKSEGQARFVQNPAYWGPMSRHNRPPVEKPDHAPRSKQNKRRHNGAGSEGGCVDGGVGAADATANKRLSIASMATAVAPATGAEAAASSLAAAAAGIGATENDGLVAAAISAIVETASAITTAVDAVMVDLVDDQSAPA